ncbi:MAG: alginate lyase family protein, partial [Candidatus Kapaibacterium sp.]
GDKTLDYHRKKKIRQLDYIRQTYSEYYDSDIIFNPIYDSEFIRFDIIERTKIIETATEICRHRFNLLGSCLTEVAYDYDYYGYEGYKYCHSIKFSNLENLAEQTISSSNLNYSKKVIKHIGKDYHPIDWQRDFRSGFRWDSKQHYLKLTYGDKHGVDVKMPFELGRLQHFVILFYAWKFTGNESYLEEFKNQTLDFIAYNPPKFGIQWKMPMDVALRMVNLCSVLSLFHTAGADLENAFIRLVSNYIYDHQIYLLNNLEWISGSRGNHYFANICGLLYTSSFLPVDTISSFAFVLALNEFESETLYQFYPDGGNFEASLPYHNFVSEMLFQTFIMLKRIKQDRLSLIADKYSKDTAEMFILNRDLCKRIKSKFRMKGINFGKIDFSNAFDVKLKKIAEFTCDTITTNYKDINIGDSDSGFFFRFIPKINNDFSFDSSNREEIIKICNYIRKSGEQSKVKLFEDFGLYTFRNDCYEIYLRCGSLGQNGKGGHAHNDQLSFELFSGEIPLIVDSGTYTYTALPYQRNLYRSTSHHNTLTIDETEQNPIGDVKNLFWLRDKSKAKVLRYDNNSFSGSHIGYGEVHQRDLTFNQNEILGIDRCTIPKTKSVRFHLNNSAIVEKIQSNYAKIRISGKMFIIMSDSGTIKQETFFYSPAYGVKYLSNEIVIVSDFDVISWKILIND